MAETGPVERGFDLGFKSDIPRGSLPPGAVYRMKDYIPQLGAHARKRGGWSYASKDLNSASAATYLSGVAWAPYATDPHLIVVSEAGKVYQVKTFNGTAGTYLGTTSFAALTHRPFWHNDRMIILQALGAAVADPYKITLAGSTYTLAAVGGTPPKARVGWTWGDYLVLANGTVGGTAYPNRSWFSGAGTPETWTTASSFWDFPEEVVVGTMMRTFQMVWGYSNTWMLTGDTPPPGGNFARRTLFAGNGCMDGRTLSKYREYAIWANNTGVFKSDGSTLTDMTVKGDVSQFWNDTVANFNYSTGWRATADVWNGYYFITIYNPTGPVEVTLACDIERTVWFQVTNFPATMFAARSSGPGTATAGGFEEMFFASRSSPRACSVSSCWSPTSAVAADADGTNVLPEIETDFFQLGGASLKRIRRAYISYDVRTAGASPYLTVSAIFSPEDTNYVALTPTLTTSTKLERKPVAINRRATGVGLKIVQTGASADTRLHGIEIEAHPVEKSR